MFRTIAYWYALLLSLLSILVLSISIYEFYMIIEDLSANSEFKSVLPQNNRTIILTTIIIPVATLLLTAISTFFAIFFGWRVDRRQKKELELKILELERKIADQNT